MHFDGGEAHLGERGDEGRLTGGVTGRIDQRRVHAAVMRLVDLVDDLPDDIRVEDINLDTQLGGIFADVLIVFRQGHGTEDLGLDFAAHVHSGTMDYQDLRHKCVPHVL